MTEPREPTTTEKLATLREELQAAGWRIAHKPISDASDLCEWYAWQPQRPKDWPDCECNDKPPSLTLHPFLFQMREHLHGGAEISLCGEMHGQWYDLKLDSVRLEDAIATVPTAKRSLGAAWIAIAAMEQQT